VRCVECYSKEGKKKGRNGTITWFPLITIIPISAATVAAYLFVDPCGLDPIFQGNIDRMRAGGKSIVQLVIDVEISIHTIERKAYRLPSTSLQPGLEQALLETFNNLLILVGEVP